MPLVTLPNIIANGQLEDATPVMANFNALANAINTLVVPLTGPATLNGIFTFTNSPQVPTATLGDNTTNAASTAFVTQAVSGANAGTSTLKNKLINGDMLINQRMGASTTPSNVSTYFYTIDRWAYFATQASKVQVQWIGENPGVIPNYNYALSFSVTTPVVSPAAGDTFYVAQRIEANSIRDLNFGTAQASPITLSFWMSAPAGTFSGAVQNHNFTRSYPFTFTSSGTGWQFFTITIPGDTGGTWLNGGVTPSVQGMELRLINLGSGTTFLGPAGAWAAANYTGATGTVQPIVAAGVYAFTGVRLEKGSAATTDDVLPMEVSIALCQRYYEKSQPIYSSPPVQNFGTAGSFTGSQYTAGANARVLGTVFFKVQKRNASSTIVTYNPSALNAQVRDILGLDWTGTTVSLVGESSFVITGTTPVGSGVGDQAMVHWSADNEL